MFICKDLEQVYNVLDEMVPFEGPVRNVNKNKALEKFRKATNVVYDIFNNGLGNKGKSLKVLGLKKYELPLEEYRGGELLMRANWERITEIVTPIYERILLDAVKEQGIQCELIPNTSTGKLDLVPCQTS